MRKEEWKSIGSAVLLLTMADGITGCLVAGYSSSGGLFVWPGSIVITVILLLIYFFFRRGR